MQVKFSSLQNVCKKTPVKDDDSLCGFETAITSFSIKPFGESRKLFGERLVFTRETSRILGMFAKVYFSKETAFDFENSILELIIWRIWLVKVGILQLGMQSDCITNTKRERISFAGKLAARLRKGRTLLSVQ